MSLPLTQPCFCGFLCCLVDSFDCLGVWVSFLVCLSKQNIARGREGERERERDQSQPKKARGGGEARMRNKRIK